MDHTTPQRVVEWNIFPETGAARSVSDENSQRRRAINLRVALTGGGIAPNGIVATANYLRQHRSYTHERRGARSALSWVTEEWKRCRTNATRAARVARSGASPGWTNRNNGRSPPRADAPPTRR